MQSHKDADPKSSDTPVEHDVAKTVTWQEEEALKRYDAFINGKIKGYSIENAHPDYHKKNP
jgi:hypothetical protein